MKYGHLLPSLIVLLHNKLQETYHKMWNQVKILCPDACPTHLIVDFEKAALNAFESHFPQTQVKAVFSSNTKRMEKNSRT